MSKCSQCNNDTGHHFSRCDAHYRCDDCGTKEHLCTYREGVLCYDCHKKRANKRVKEFNGDHEYMQEIVCPYCGHIKSDSWEVQPDNNSMECSDCENTFEYERIIAIEYSTSKTT